MTLLAGTLLRRIRKEKSGHDGSEWERGLTSMSDIGMFRQSDLTSMVMGQFRIAPEEIQTGRIRRWRLSEQLQSWPW
jgi:hypothetical protein